MPKKHVDKTLLALRAAMLARIPVMLVGEPGVGKTATMRKIAQEIGYELIILVGSQMEPTDIAGLPHKKTVVIDNEEIDCMDYLPTWWQIHVLKNKKVILFFDEFTNTSPSTRASLLTLFADREFPNGKKMPKETIVVGAMNPVEQAADGYELDEPTKNRIFFLPFDPPMSSWLSGMRNAWGRSISDEEMSWKNKIANFIEDNPTWLSQKPAEVSTKSAYGIKNNDITQSEVLKSAYATRRSWDNLSKVLSKTPDDEYTQDLVAQGIVGFAASASFRDWLRKNDKISPYEVLENPGFVDWDKITVNDSNLIFRSIVQIIDSKNALQAINLMKYVVDHNKGNLIGPFVKDFIKKSRDKNIDPNIRKEVVTKLREMLPQLTKYVSVVDKS